MLAAQSKIQVINKARHEAQTDANDLTQDDADGPQVMGEAKSAMDDALGMNANPPDTLDSDTRVGMLNTDQSRIFDRVKEHLLHQKRHADGICQCDIKPLRMFVSGVGGTGKSFLIEAIRALVASIWPHHDLTCAITAPMGLAAFNVGGVTVHRLFQLPIEHEGRTAGYWSL